MDTRLSNKIGIVMGGYLDENGRLMDREERNRRISDLQDFEKKATVEIVVLRTHILNAIGALKNYDPADVLDVTIDELIPVLEKAVLNPLPVKQVLDSEELLQWIKHGDTNNSEILHILKERINEGQFDLQRRNHGDSKEESNEL